MQCRYYTDEERVEIRRELLKEMEERKVCVSASVSLSCLNGTHAPRRLASGQGTCAGVWGCGGAADEEEHLVCDGTAWQDGLKLN